MESEGTNLLITRETDYALRILRALSNGEQITTKEICEKELLPQQFVYKIIKRLSHAGLVGIARGSGGGCRLIADLKKVSLYDLAKIMDADSLVSACMQPGYKCAARQKRGAACVTNKQLRQIQDTIDRELKKRSLYAMLFDV
jgi:Rrf2 family protein